MPQPAGHYREAAGCVESAARAVDRPEDYGDAAGHVEAELRFAQVHASLAICDRLDRIAETLEHLRTRGMPSHGQ